ncbi:MAG: aspartate ammonia-lyase [Nitrospinota bacterium]|nr:MAG: aspartate ammonia-lyase [Nitrospinota bacterium]
MEKIATRLQESILFTHLTPEEIAYLAQKMRRKAYRTGEYLFYESTPRQAFYVIEAGEVELFKGYRGRVKSFGVVRAGGTVSEGLWLDEPTHFTSARARQDTLTIQLSLARYQEIRTERPETFARIVLRIGQLLRAQLRELSAKWETDEPRFLSGRFRQEHDLLGTRDIPIEAYYGIQTMRALENFPITSIPLREFPHLIYALAAIKKAAALTNFELGLLLPEIQRAIVQACDEIMAGQHHQYFVVDVIQGGAGTSTNMNANEVIANRALEILGHAKGAYHIIHPNTHVNLSQSTNDVYPTAIKIALRRYADDLLKAMTELQMAFRTKADEFADVLKLGRTQLQDAVPMTLGQEFSAYSTTIGEDLARLREAVDLAKEINLGATAIGTGINTDPRYARLVCKKLREITGIPLITAPNLVEATQDTGVFVLISGVLKRIAVKLSKICNDLRLLSSGPQGGFHEINLPPMQPGSSIMPGKVNPVIPEVVNQVAYQVIGNDLTVTMAAEAGQLELNAMEPVIAFNLFQSISMLRNACITLRTRCIEGITANKKHCRTLVEKSIGLATALNPYLGYEQSTALAKEALATGRSVYELVLEKGILSKEKLEEILSPEQMIRPRRYQ